MDDEGGIIGEVVKDGSGNPCVVCVGKVIGLQSTRIKTGIMKRNIRNIDFIFSPFLIAA